LETLLYLLGAAALAVGVIGTVAPGLPGAPFLAGGALLVAWADDFRRLGWPSLVTVAVLAGLTVAIDLLAAAAGAKLSGASRWALWGAAIGLLAGLFLGVAGVLLGPVVGAFALELLKNPDLRHASRAGAAVGVAMLLASVVRVALAVAAVGVVVVAWFV
jgi:uncharacterized protein YqgC (DUF456 family)